MANLYPDALIQQVLDRSNIVDVISSYIPLKRAGRSYKAVCPFHAEKTPSFIVSLDKQIFHCFGCGVGGNVLTFIMQYEKIGFRDALETLARKSGVTLPEPEQSDEQKRRKEMTQDIFAVYAQAVKFYHTHLMTSAEANHARTYMSRRGISKETAARFLLGYAPADWDRLLKFLRSQGVALSLIEQAGLIVSNDRGGHYDRFRGRIIFPIIDLKDRAVACGGRILDDSLPKYINSPESPIYTKGRHLFGLNAARDAIREKDCVVVVEGYLDQIVPFEAGIRHVVASLGTALTIEQVRLLKRFTCNVILLYDPDAAGEMAALRALELLLQEDMNVRVAELPDHEDPDTYVRRCGKDALQEILDQAKPIFDYKLNYYVSRHGLMTIEAKRKIIQELLPTIHMYPDQVVRAEYLRKTAECLRIDEKALWQDFNKHSAKESMPDTIPESIAVRHSFLSQVPITERMLLKLLLEEMHLADKIRDMVDLSDFREDCLREIAQVIFEQGRQGVQTTPGALISQFGNDRMAGVISELATMEIHECPNKEQLLFDCVDRLKRDNIMHRCKELHRRMEDAQCAGDKQGLQHLIAEYSVLLRQRSQVHGQTCGEKEPR